MENRWELLTVESAAGGLQLAAGASKGNDGEPDRSYYHLNKGGGVRFVHACLVDKQTWTQLEEPYALIVKLWMKSSSLDFRG
jgi:hypothetical protein